MTLPDVWFEVVLKVPLIVVAVAVWWAIHQEPDEPPAADDGDGGVRLPRDCERTPLRPLPRSPRRGPHGGLAPPAPPRSRTVRARACTYGR